MIETIGFELTTKRRNILNVVRNIIPDGGSYLAESLADKFLQKDRKVVQRGF